MSHHQGEGPDEWLLIDAEDRARSYPDAWKIPGRDERTGLAAGDRARIGFELIDIPNRRLGAEGVWVRILERGSSEEYVAEVLVSTIAVGLRKGERVSFFARHVLGLERTRMVR